MKHTLLKSFNRLIGISLTFCIFSGSCLSAYAGEWKSDLTGKWYQQDDGSYPSGGWTWLDDNLDGLAECYYFNNYGYLVASAITPDGYLVNEKGAWVQDGILQQIALTPAARNAEKNRHAVTAYRNKLLNEIRKEKDLFSYPTSFAVVDVNGDGIFEVLLNYQGAAAGWGGNLLYFTDRIHEFEGFYPYSYSYNPQNGYIMSFYVHQGISFAVEQFTGTELIHKAEIGISDYLDENNFEAEKAEALQSFEQIRQWSANTLEIILVDLTEENINTYLSGNGLSTGTKISTIYQDVRECWLVEY